MGPRAVLDLLEKAKIFLASGGNRSPDRPATSIVTVPRLVQIRIMTERFKERKRFAHSYRDLILRSPNAGRPLVKKRL